jgi:hypothetical protein
LIAWPPAAAAKMLYRNFVSYLVGRVLRDNDRIYSIKFVWYGETVYLHPMIWGSLLLFVLAQTAFVGQGWLLLLWFLGLLVCYVTIMYNFDVIKTAILGTAVVALLGLAYFATIELSWNPLAAVARHVVALEATVSPGFYLVSAYLFTLLISIEVVWAWLFHRVEIDESYVYEHQFLRGTAREPIFAQGLKRETKDLLEMALMGAADIQHRTKKGFKRFKNVPFASLWLGTAIDSLLDHRRNGQILLERKSREAADAARISDAFPDQSEDWDDDLEEGESEDGDASESEETAGSVG